MISKIPTPGRSKLQLTKQALAGLSALLVVGFIVGEPLAMMDGGALRTRASLVASELARVATPARPRDVKKLAGRVREKPSIGSPELARRDGTVCLWVKPGEPVSSVMAQVPVERLDLPPPVLG